MGTRIWRSARTGYILDNRFNQNINRSGFNKSIFLNRKEATSDLHWCMSESKGSHIYFKKTRKVLKIIRSNDVKIDTIAYKSGVKGRISRSCAEQNSAFILENEKQVFPF